MTLRRSTASAIVAKDASVRSLAASKDLVAVMDSPAAPK